MSKTRILSLCCALAALSLASVAWAGGYEDYAAMPKAWEAAYNSGEIDSVVAFYAEDGMRMPPNAEIAVGPEGIAAQLQAGMDQGLAQVEIEAVEHKISGQLGFARGTFKAIDKEGNTLDKGKWLQIGKMIDGKWYTHCDIWNSDMPLPAPE